MALYTPESIERVRDAVDMLDLVGAKTELRRILAELAATGVAVLISTHDVEFAAAASERTILMSDGELIADGATAALLTSSPAYAPQMAKVFAPVPVLTPQDVAKGLA